MTKKSCAVLVLVIFVAGGLAAADIALSLGAGAYLGGEFGGGIKATGNGMTSTIKTPYFGGGGFVFLDLTYAELSFGFFRGGGKVKTSIASFPVVEYDLSITNLNIGLLGKYPIAVGDRISVFPLFGIDYQVTVAGKVDDTDIADLGDNPFYPSKPGELSALWFKGGIGADFGITGHLFLRSDLLYGLRVPNKYEKDLRDDATGGGITAKPRLGNGLTVKIALGYTF
jgi:hypothetical protein